MLFYNGSNLNPRSWLIITFFSMLFLFPIISVATPPPAKDVFQLSVKHIDPNTFSLDWSIKKGFFLYKKKINVIQSPSSNVQLGTIRFPKALKRSDTQGSILLVYRNHVSIPVAVLGEKPGETILEVHYQGCSDDGFCYPPETQPVKVTINDSLALTNINIEKNNALPLAEENTPNESSNLSKLFSTNNWGMIILSFFGFGLLLSFTPCVLPMVPVLSGIIVGHGKDISTSKAFFLSLSYVTSMSITYAAIGAVVAVMGSNLQVIMQSPWAISLFSLIFVLLALSMFNVYELRLPSSWQAKLTGATPTQNRGHYVGAAIMGCLATLILSPCVTAPLIGALGYIAQTGNVALGSLCLFFLGFGMGTPLLLIGTSAGKLLPQAGQWMDTVKSFFGVMLLAVAIYLMDRILPATLIMVLWAALSIFSGIYMGALTKSKSKQDKFHQGLGIILLVYGLLILLGASQGKTNPLQPLAATNQVEPQKNPVEVVTTLNQLQQAIRKATGKPIMLDFYADWCASCKILEKTTLHDPRVKSSLANFVVVKADLTANDADSSAMLNHYNVVAPPTFIFFNAEGKELTNLQLVGEISPEALYATLSKIMPSKAN